MPQLPVVLPFIFGVVEASSSLAVTVNTDVVFTYNADSGLAVEAAGSGGAVRNTETETTVVAVTVDVSAGIQLNGVLDSGVEASVSTSGDVQYNQHLDTDLGVVADLSGAGLNAAAEGGALAVTVDISGLADMDATGDINTPAAVSFDAAALNNAPISGDVVGVAGVSAQAQFNGTPQGDLGAIAGLSGAARKATFAAADRAVTVTITAGASLAQRVQSSTAITASRAGVPVRNVFAGAVPQIVAGLSAAGLVDAVAGTSLSVAGDVSASMKLNQVISAPLALTIVFAARGQLDGTPDERIALIEAVIRLVELESREGPLLVAADNRTTSVGGNREMLVE